MSCRDGRCEFQSKMHRDVKVSLEQRVEADLWLKDYLAELMRVRPDLAERVVKEERLSHR